MRLALDTYRDVVSGDQERRIHALFTFALWFVAGAFVVSAVTFYIVPMESLAVSVFGGAVVSAFVAAIKLV